MFDKMISKALIEWIWVGASVIVAIVGLGWIVSQPSPGRFAIASVALLLYLGLVRVAAESMIVIFNIDDNLRRIRTALEQSPSGQAVGRSGVKSIEPAQYRSQAPLPTRSQPSQGISDPYGKGHDSTEVVSSKGDDVDAPKHDSYHDRMMAVRDQLQRDAQEKRRY